MTKIGAKLLFGSGVFICILILHTLLVQMTTEQAMNSHRILTKKTAPALSLLSEIRMDNKELFLLTENKVAEDRKSVRLKRVEWLVEVELPSRINSLVLLKRSLESSDTRNITIDSIAEYASKSFKLVKKINQLLETSSDYEDIANVYMTITLLTKKLSAFTNIIDNQIASLQTEYNQGLETNFSDLSNTLKSNSRFFLWFSLLFICFGLIITYRNTMAIVTPIDNLLKNVENIQKGNYEKRVSIKGTDELSKLGIAFNQMSDSLQTSFNEIKLKNKELEHFVYIASHDLQEPLRTVNSFTELLVKDYKDTLDETATVYIKFISEASTRMSLLVKGLLDYGRIGMDKEITIVNCNDMIKDIAHTFSDLIAAKSVTLEIAVLPEIYGYASDLKLLFKNLMHNAIKFHRPNASPIVKITAEEHPEFWQFIISDNGIGIQEHQKQKVFAMFQRLNPKDQYAGIGIGLAYCSKIIAMHQGAITVDSEKGIGSSFSVTISKNLKQKKNLSR